MKYQPKYPPGTRVIYNSLMGAGATKGTIKEVNTDEVPHEYTMEPDIFPGKEERVLEYHIGQQI